MLQAGFVRYPDLSFSNYQVDLCHLPFCGGNSRATFCIYRKDAKQWADSQHQSFPQRSRIPYGASRCISSSHASYKKTGSHYVSHHSVPRPILGDITSNKMQEPTNRRMLVKSLVAGLIFLMDDRLPGLAVPANKNSYNEQQLIEQNKRVQKLNNAPPDFPIFVREGFDVKLVNNDKYVRCESGLIYMDIQEGYGDYPKDGQQVIFYYIGYNESGRQIDSSYQQGQPSKAQIGIKGLIPGFEEGIRSMKAGGKRRIVVPPELGPPVGPSTFFSAKQFEVFDVELLSIKDCKRRTIGFFSNVFCD